MNENCKKKKCDNKIIIRDRIKKSYFPIPIKSNIKHIKNKSWFDINCNSFLTDNKIENKRIIDFSKTEFKIDNNN